MRVIAEACRESLHHCEEVELLTSCARTVPMGLVSGLPVGVSFFGQAWSEPTLLKIAYAYEQASKRRQPPTFQATLG